MSYRVVDVSLARIVIPAERARSKMTEEQQQFLRASLAKYGCFVPIVVRPVEGERYELICGENRVKEAIKLGRATIRAAVLELSDKDAAIVNLLENVARGEQDPMGMARVIKKALDAGMSVEEIAKATGHTTKWVQRMIVLLDLPEEYQHALEENRLKVGHIWEAMRLPNPQEIDNALQTALNLRWNVSTFKNFVDNRIAELEAHARALREGVAESPEPPAPRPELAKYTQCMGCSRTVTTDVVMLPRLCRECFALLRYITTQLGTGQDAMKLIYESLTVYLAYQNYMRQFMAQQAFQTMTQQGQLSQQQGQDMTQSQPQVLTPQDRKLQKAKQEGIRFVKTPFGPLPTLSGVAQPQRRREGEESQS